MNVVSQGLLATESGGVRKSEGVRELYCGRGMALARERVVRMGSR